MNEEWEYRNEDYFFSSDKQHKNVERKTATGVLEANGDSVFVVPFDGFFILLFDLLFIVTRTQISKNDLKNKINK